MAEATQTTTSTATESLTESTTSATDAPSTGAQSATQPPKEGAQESTAKVGRGPSALDRAVAALDKHEASGKETNKEAAAEKPEAKEAEPEKDEKVEPKPEAKPDEKPAEEKAKEQRLSRSLAILEERESRLRRAAKDFEAKQTEWSSQQQSEVQDLTVLRTVRGHLAKGDQLSALEALGIDLPKAVELMSRKIDPTPEDIQRKIVREEFEAREKAAKEAEERSKAEASEREKATEQVEQQEFLERLFSIPASKYPFTVHRKVSGDQIWAFQKSMRTELGRAVTHTEVLDRIEGLVKTDYEAAQQLLKPAEPPKPVTTPPAAKPAEPLKPKAPEREKPTEPQRRQPQKRESASARAEAAMKRLGIQ